MNPKMIGVSGAVLACVALAACTSPRRTAYYETQTYETRRPVYPADAPVYEEACERPGIGNQAVGAAIGAAVGGLLGSQVGAGKGNTAATIAGVLGGGLIGSQVGASMDRADEECVAYALERAPSGHVVTWRDPDDDRRYRVTPREVFYRDRMPCREVTTEAWIGGRREYVQGVACRQPDGTWEFQG